MAHSTADSTRLGEYYDSKYTHFGALRVFNDDTLSPRAVWLYIPIEITN